MLVIVTGPPGGGKTTVARALAERSDRGVHFESDELYHWIVSGFVAPHLPEAHEQNVAVMNVALATVCAYSDAGYDVFWDGVIGPWWLDQIRAGLGKRVADTHYLILRPDQQTALNRVKERDGTTEVSGAEPMYQQFQDVGTHEKHVIDSDKDAEDVVTTCQQVITARTHLLSANETQPPR